MIEFANFFNHPFFVIIGGISTLLAIISFFYAIYIILSGVLPIWIRLGRSISNKKIAVYAEHDFDSLKSHLIDSGIFKEKNIEKVTNNSLSKGETHTMMLVNYMEFKDKVEEILKYKKDSDALIIYAPQTGERIEQSLMNRICDTRNTIVVTLRGRLMNDILTSMITTLYEKR